MRRRRINTQPKEIRDAPKEVLAEGLTKKSTQGNTIYNDIGLVKRRRQELVAQGLNDNQISSILAEETGWKAVTVYVAIRRLVQSGDLPKNPYKQEKYTPDQLEYVRNKRQELAAIGFKDSPIAKKLATEMGRNSGSIFNLICHMVKKGEIHPNPNREPRREFSEQEIKVIKQMRQELSATGMADKRIAEKIANEMGRYAGSVEALLRGLVSKGELPHNPNKKKKLSPDEVLQIIKMRQELVVKGMRDTQIAEKIALKLGRHLGTIVSAIARYKRKGELTENPNRQKKKSISKEILETIRRRRQELLVHNLNDKRISKQIAGETDLKLNSVDQIIRAMVAKGTLPENPNKRRFTSCSQDEIRLVVRMRGTLARKGLNDGQIARTIAEKTGQKTERIRSLLKRLKSKSKLCENGNKLVRKNFTEDEIRHAITEHKRLSAEGWTDMVIGKKIAVKTKRHPNSYPDLFRRLVLDGRMAPNPNKRIRKNYTENDSMEIMRLRQELASQGINDWNAAKAISKKLGRTAFSVMCLISKMVKQGKLPKNTKNKNAEPPKEELLSGLRQAPEAMERFGEGK